MLKRNLEDYANLAGSVFAAVIYSVLQLFSLNDGLVLGFVPLPFMRAALSKSSVLSSQDDNNSPVGMVAVTGPRAKIIEPLQ